MFRGEEKTRKLELRTGNAQPPVIIITATPQQASAASFLQLIDLFLLSAFSQSQSLCQPGVCASLTEGGYRRSICFIIRGPGVRENLSRNVSRGEESFFSFLTCRLLERLRPGAS